MKDEAQADGSPLCLGQEGAQVRLRLDRISRRAESETTAEAQDVRVDRQPRQPESDRADHVGRLAPDAGQGDELLHRLRYLAVEALGDRARHCQEVPALRPEEARRADQLLDILEPRGGEGPRIGVAPEKRRGHHVHPFVSALGREDRGDEELVRTVVHEGTQLCRGAGIGLSQP